MHSRLLPLLVVAVLTSGGFVMLNKDSATNNQVTLMEQSFLNWQQKFAKKYDSTEEFNYRLAVFTENFNYIYEQNSKQNSYTLGTNKFMDLSKEEFQALYQGYKPKQQVVYENEEPVEVLGDDIDWRTKGAVTAVKNQGQCGSYWAFSATGSMEGSFFLFGKVDLPSLSESQLVDCCKYGNQGCNGGLIVNAFKYAKAHKMTTEAQYPYKPADELCKSSVVAESKYQITGYTDVLPAGSVSALYTAVTIQPVAVFVDSSNWQFYSGGIFNNCEQEIDHSALVVGFTSTYWIVKNSWDKDWGEEGYIRLSPGNTCGIANYASYPQV